MEQAIKIAGMTCEGCRKGVTEKLLTLPGVAQANVDLQNGSALIQGTQNWSIEEIEKVLGAKYKVTQCVQATADVLPHTQSKLQQLFPLFLIFGYLTAGAFFLQWVSEGTRLFMYDFMGLFFLIFSFFKFLDYQGFPASFARYDPIAKRTLAYAYAYPFIETLLGLCFLFEWQIAAALIVTFVLLFATTVGVLHALINKRIIECACLGTALKLPMTQATLIENAIMLVMCVYSLALLWF